MQEGVEPSPEAGGSGSKMEKVVEKIKLGNEIKLSKEALEALGVKIGEEIILMIKGREVVIKPAKSIIDEVAGAAELEDTELIDKIIEDTEFKR